MTKILHKVPTYSQYLDVVNKRWRDNACGIVALYQVLEYFLAPDGIGSIPHFIQQGIKKGAYSAKQGGWIHGGLADIARVYGVEARVHDEADTSDAQAFFSLLKVLKNGPVLVSIHKDFDPSGGGHLIVATGYQKKGSKVELYYNEPASRTRKGIRKQVSERIFLLGWKKRFIAFHKPSITPLLFDNYLATIKKSVGSKMFQSVSVRKNGKKTDITKRGELSCATYVSSIFVMFGLIGARHATVEGTLKDMQKSGWRRLREPKPGAVLVWGPWEKSTHQHIGFYLGSGRAISNSAEKRVPARHHWTFGTNGGEPKRKVISVWWHQKLDSQKI